MRLCMFTSCQGHNSWPRCLLLQTQQWPRNSQGRKFHRAQHRPLTQTQTFSCVVSCQSWSLGYLQMLGGRNNESKPMKVFLADGVRFGGIHHSFSITSDEEKNSAPAESYHKKLDSVKSQSSEAKQVWNRDITNHCSTIS